MTAGSKCTMSVLTVVEVKVGVMGILALAQKDGCSAHVIKWVFSDLYSKTENNSFRKI